MAGSQVPFPYDPPTVAALKAALSPERYATYHAEAKGDDELALELYRYNGRLAGAFMDPLGMAEVTLRNAVDTILTSLHGPDWPTDPGFRGILGPHSSAALDRALERTFHAHACHPRGQVVATLTFDFWSNLFRPEYDRPLWQVNLRKVFPYAPATVTRPDIQVLVRDINRLRNRIAHHEPIMRQDVSARHSDIVRLVGYRCPTTAGWLRHGSAVSAAIRTKPRPGGAARRVADKCDTEFQIVLESHRLDEVLAAYRRDVPAIVCVDAKGCPSHLLTALELATFTAMKAAEADGLVAFADHTIGDLVAAGMTGRWAALDSQAPDAAIAATLRDALVRGIVATEVVDGLTIPRGVILRAHRRY